MRTLTYILTAVTLLGGCRSSSEPIPLQPVPFQLRSSVPADSVTILSSQTDFSAFFDQEIPASEVRVRIIPEPISLGSVSTHGRTFDQLEIELSARGLAHWLLLDGPRFLRPYRVRVFTGYAGGSYDFPDPDNQPCLVVGELGQIGQIEGDVSKSPGGPDPQYTVIFAFHVDDLPADPDPTEIFFLAPPVAIALAELDAQNPGDWGFRMESLLIYEVYALIAVLDTSGDGVYDPREDWWGYPQDPESRSLSYAEAHIDACTPRIGLIELRPPIE
jgi:hypothetical protein